MRPRGPWTRCARPREVPRGRMPTPTATPALLRDPATRPRTRGPGSGTKVPQVYYPRGHKPAAPPHPDRSTGQPKASLRQRFASNQPLRPPSPTSETPQHPSGSCTGRSCGWLARNKPGNGAIVLRYLSGRFRALTKPRRPQEAPGAARATTRWLFRGRLLRARGRARRLRGRLRPRIRRRGDPRRPSFPLPVPPHRGCPAR